jgi:subtilase family protein/type IX secretion system substrate protein
MNATVLRSGAILVLFFSFLAAYAGPIGVEQIKKHAPPTSDAIVAPGTIIIMLKAGTAHHNSGTSLSIAALDNILERINTSKVKAFHTMPALYKGEDSPAARLARMFRIDFGAPEESYALCAEIAAIPNVEFAEPYYWFTPDYTPDDPMLANQWAVRVMNLEAAWDVSQGSEDVAIGIVDSGVNYDHVDLAANIFVNQGEWGTSGELKDNGIDDDNNGFVDDWRGWDFGEDDNDPMDNGILIGGSRTYHGTMAAGCASAVTDNNIGVAGAGFKCKIIPIKAARDNGSGIVSGYEGIKYASDVGAKVVSCSWGSVGGTAPLSLQAIIDYVMANGTLVVGSAGNDPNDNDYLPHYPSSLRGVVGVGSVETSGAISTWCTFGTTVDVYAPGVSVRTTNGSSNSSYTTTMGTSFSCPYTAGVAGLIFAIHPDWTPAMVGKQLRVTARRSSAANPKRYGRVDAEAAVTMNTNIDDTPGLLIDNLTFPYENGVLFNELGQTSTFTVRLKNILAPTSANATAMIEFDQGYFYPVGGPQTIGVIPTGGTAEVSFTVQLADTALFSEGAFPFRVRIDDGELIDYLPATLDIYITEAWHRRDFNFRPSYNSIDIVDKKTVWTVSRVEGPQGVFSEDAWVTLDGGLSWIDANNGNGWPSQRTGIYCVHGVDENTAMFGLSTTTVAAIYRTTNRGGSWTGAMVLNETRFINFIHMFDENFGIYQGDPRSGYWGIGFTTDAGVSWSRLTDRLVAPSGELGWNNAYDVVGDMVWFGTNVSKIYKSLDRGMTWTSYPLPAKNSVGVSFRNENVGAVRFSVQETTNPPPGDINGVAVTEDGGLTWSMLNTLTLTQGGAIELEPNGKRLWVINDGNNYESLDLGQSWRLTAVPTSFFISCTDILVNEGDAETHVWGGGAYLYNYTSPYQKVVSVPATLSLSDFTIHSVYPNPANVSNGGVSLDFSIPSQGMTEVRVYDYTGRLVKTAVQASLTSGRHSAYVDFQSLPAGKYFLHLSHGDAVQVSNVTITR